MPPIKSQNRLAGHRWFWPAFAALGLGIMIWQNHAASSHAEQLAERVEVLAATTSARAMPADTLRNSFAPSPAVRRVHMAASQANRPEIVPPPSASPAASPEQVERLAVARGIADDILRSRQLTPENVDALRVELDQLPRAEAFEIRRRIAHAINTSELVPTQDQFTLP